MTEEYATFEPSSQLTFVKSKDQGDFSQPVITITNKSTTDALLFRIQTTSPLSYRVRPSHGRVGPSESIEVQVIMVADSKKIDKFLIRCAPIASTVTGDFTEMFASVEPLAKDHRLKCVVVGREEGETALLANDTAPMDAGGPNDVQAGEMVSSPLPLSPNMEGFSNGYEGAGFERSASSLINTGAAIASPPHEQSVSGNENEEQLQRELSKTRQQVRELATRNQELSQRLSAVEQSGVRLRDIAGASARDRSHSPSQHSSKSALNHLADTVTREHAVLGIIAEYYNWANTELEGIIPMSTITPVMLLGLCLLSFIIGTVFFSK